MEITKEFRFEASHILPRHPGKCSRLHGHSWVLRVSVEGPINPKTGFVMDYADISRVVNPLIESLDHRHLGQWKNYIEAEYEIILMHHPDFSVKNLPLDFYPSSENLLVWIGSQLLPQTKPGTASSEVNTLWEGLNWSKLTLNETCTSSAVLTREEYNSLRA